MFCVCYVCKLTLIFVWTQVVNKILLLLAKPLYCLHNHVFKCRWKKTSKLQITGLCEGNSPVTSESPHKGPVTQKMCLFDDVIMLVHSSSIPAASATAMWITALIARFMGPTWGPYGADRTQVGPMLAPWTLLSGWNLYPFQWTLVGDCNFVRGGNNVHSTNMWNFFNSLDKMAAFSQTIFSDAFSWMKNVVFW